MEPGAVATRFVVPQMVTMSTVPFDTYKTFSLVKKEMDLKVGEK